jgi:hypothetical protein
LAEGRLLFDRSGLGMHYKTLARDVVAGSLEPMTEQQILSRRFLLTELLDDLADSESDLLQARWLMCSGLRFVVDTAFLWHRRWTPKDKWALEETEALDRGLASNVKVFLGAEGSEQVDVFEAMVKDVLGWMGGELREPWSRLPEAVSEMQ